MNKKDILKIGLILALTVRLTGISIQLRAFDHPDFSRFVIKATSPLSYSFNQQPNLLEVEIHNRIESFPAQTEFKNSRLIKRVSFHQEANRNFLRIETRQNFLLKRSFVLEKPFRIVFDLIENSEKQIAPKAQTEQQQQEEKVTENFPPPENEKTTEKKLYHKPIEIICIDPGHGGEDLGAVGSGQTYEKTITLDISMRLKKLLEDRLGLRVILTRDRDVEVPLNNRASIANNQNAQLFISIHANSSFRKSASGAETYYVSLKATDDEAMQLAIKENAKWLQEEEQETDDSLQLILWNMIQTEYIKESSKLAEFVQTELNNNLKTLDRGVKQAPFRVLMRVAMPAILVEVGFLSNPDEEKKLKNNDHLQRIALSIFSGISRFISYYQEYILK